MPRARKRPIEIEFLEWTGKKHRDMFEFLGGSHDEYITPGGKNFYIDHSKVDGGLIIKTLEGEHAASIGDMIIKGINGEFYPCKADIFAKTYDILDASNKQKTVYLDSYESLIDPETGVVQFEPNTEYVFTKPL